MLLPFLLLAGVQLALGQFEANCYGNQVVVQLFEWKWTDIEQECLNFLAEAGYCGVQVSPPNEHIDLPEHPWWQRYQPVSYQLESRSGTRDEFVSMVETCNSVGVRIYVDAVMNHMTDKTLVGVSPYGGSPYDGPNHDYPAVPYTPDDFTPSELCTSPDGDVANYNDPDNVRNCNYLGLNDLYGASGYVQDTLADYLNELARIGVAGVRIDAAKYMHPADIEAILSRVDFLPTAQGFPPDSKLFVYQDVQDYNEDSIKAAEYVGNGLVMEYRFGQNVARAIMEGDYTSLNTVVDPADGMLNEDEAFVFIDNMDVQRQDSITHPFLTYKIPSDYYQAVGFMLAFDYGFAQVMSSYDFTTFDQGPPTNPDGSTTDPIVNDSCNTGWICEHRWTAISRMVRFRNYVAGTPVLNYFNTGSILGFSRGDKCFFAMSLTGRISRTSQTGLPPGTYRNLIDDAAPTITVSSIGTATIVLNNPNVPIIAYCVDNAIKPTTTTEMTTTTTETPGGYRRTVVFVQKIANGQDFFIRGGIEGQFRPNCTTDAETSPCAIDIAVNSLGGTSYYQRYNAWRVGDTKLDFYGAQVNQGTYLGLPARGTPMALTSNNVANDGYQPLNRWGENYWMVDMDMDCSQGINGWFEVRSILGTEYEPDIDQSDSCTGTAGGQTPTTSTLNHVARCGYINLFYYGVGACQIDYFEDAPGTTATSISTDSTATASTTVTPTSPTGTSTASPPSFGNRTIIFIQQQTQNGEYVFLRGGLNKTDCSSVTDTACSIPIETRPLTPPASNPTFYQNYDAWRVGDTHLDWRGGQPGQGTYLNVPASGTITGYTTNVTGQPGYQVLNKYGDSFWMVDMDMDCSGTANGWFEFYRHFVYSNGGSDNDYPVTQPSVCGGAVGPTLGSIPFTSQYHVAHCGYVNVFYSNQGACIIDPIV